MVVDADSLMYLLGTKIDYKEDDISAEFVFDNPLVVFGFDYYIGCINLWLWRKFLCEIPCLLNKQHNSYLKAHHELD